MHVESNYRLWQTSGAMPIHAGMAPPADRSNGIVAADPVNARYRDSPRTRFAGSFSAALAKEEMEKVRAESARDRGATAFMSTSTMGQYGPRSHGNDGIDSHLGKRRICKLQTELLRIVFESPPLRHLSETSPPAAAKGPTALKSKDSESPLRQRTHSRLIGSGRASPAECAPR
jgi:hypothetical protein